MLKKYEHLKGNPEPCMLSLFCCGILLMLSFRWHNFPSLPVRILPRDATQVFGRRSRLDYAADYILSLLYISMVLNYTVLYSAAVALRCHILSLLCISMILNYAVLCFATFAFSDLPFLCCVGGAVDPAGAVRDVFVARCRYLSPFRTRISHPSLPITCFTKIISHRYRQLRAK